MADAIKLKAALAGHTDVLAFSYTDKSGRLDAIWKIIRGRHAVLIAEKPLQTIRAKEFRDLADEATRLRDVLRDTSNRHEAEMRRYRDAIDTLNSRLPEADRLQKIQTSLGVYVADTGGGVRRWGSGGSGGTSSEAVSDWLGRNPPPLPEPPIGYAWPKVEPPAPVGALEKRVAALEALWRPFKPEHAPVSTPQKEPDQ